MLPRSLVATATVLLSACAAQPAAVPPVIVERPLDVLPAGVDPAVARADLLATARTRFGDAAVDKALSSPAHLIVKRFAGMVPPPPPGSGTGWPPTPAALLVKDGAGWKVATDAGWRPAKDEGAERLNALLADEKLWTEPAFTPACPDFGSGNLLLKVPGHAETVRVAQCMSIAASLVDAALRS